MTVAFGAYAVSAGLDVDFGANHARGLGLHGVRHQTPWELLYREHHACDVNALWYSLMLGATGRAARVTRSAVTPPGGQTNSTANGVTS